MFYNIVRDYADIISNYSVTQFTRFASASSLLASIEFSDHSILHVKDYLFIDGTRKYAYHWQDASGQMRIRWDNSPHHDHIATFPHHKHIFPHVVTESQERDLREVLTVIRQIFYESK